MNAWTVILAAGLGSYLFRLSMIVLFERITMPALWVATALLPS
jgi:branched-subunit amino acid transport protein